MKKLISILLCCLFVITGLSVAKDIDTSKDELKYTGKFKWNRKADKEYDVKAVFVKNEDGNYDAKFLFDWNKKPYTYTGIVKGDVEKGPISGEIYNESKKRKRKFTFECAFKDGKFTGTHKEITKKSKETGVIYFSKDKS